MISLIIPYLERFQSDFSYDFRCDFSLMASRWYHAGVCGNTQMTSEYPSEDDERLHFVYDYFFLSHPVWGRCMFPPPKQRNIVVFSECSEYVARDPAIRNITSVLSAEYNPLATNYLGYFSTAENYKHKLVAAFNNSNRITVSLGTLHSLCQKSFQKDKVLLLDEPHRVVLNDLSGRSKQHVFSYEKSLKICKILFDRGWKIKTFCTRDKHDLFSSVKNRFPWLEVISFEKLWVPYLDLLDVYKGCFVFFSHYQETHGFSVYENLQMGNGVVVFEENFNPLTIRQFQNGAKLSLYMDDDLCADLVEAYYFSLGINRSTEIAKESHDLFSADTFAKRLKQAVCLHCGSDRILPKTIPFF